ncbi:alkane monooxygenase [Ilyonectria destructans]|nr:alkane monooxygenase [Ilyonectria destructans]
MKRPLVFNYFAMNTPSHLTHGTWRIPGSRNSDYNKLDFWVDMAKLAEETKVDGIFFADVFGLHEAQGGDWGKIPRLAVQFPISDPSVLISAMAAATKEIGLMYTNSVLQSHPFSFARTISTLDHLTEGRVGWNIVTGGSRNGARSMGRSDIMDHDTRYALAAEYADVTYKLWEGSWDPGAVVMDRENYVYSDPEKVHKINHRGEHYSVEGPHLVEPSPQRVPVIFQAGASGPGVAFAGQQAEGAFIISGSPESAAKKIAAIKKEALAAGRREEDIHFLEGTTLVVGETDEDALRKEAEFESYFSDEAHSLMFAGGTGLDLSKYDPEMPLEELIGIAPGMKGAFEMTMATIKGRKAVVRDQINISAKNYRLVGSPQTIADKMEQYRDVGVTGFNIMSMVMPGTFQDFSKLLAPELKKRGLMQTEYRPGTLREKLFPGTDRYINERHPAYKYRFHFKNDTDGVSG